MRMRNWFWWVVTPPGFEPGTCGLKVRCSAVELESRARNWRGDYPTAHTPNAATRRVRNRSDVRVVDMSPVFLWDPKIPPSFDFAQDRNDNICSS